MFSGITPTDEKYFLLNFFENNHKCVPFGLFITKINLLLLLIFCIKIQREHIYDYFQKISAKNILHLYDISSLRERKNLIDLPYLDDHSFYF
jgi:hypothetical protein